MQVNFGSISTQGSEKPKNTQKEKTPAKQSRRDRVSISGKSPKVSHLQNQRKSTKRARDRLVRSTKQRGESIATIRIKLLLYEHKMRNLDDQIARAVAEDTKAQLQKELEKTQGGKLQPDAETGRLAKEAGLAAQQTMQRELAATHAKAKGEIQRLASDVRQAQQRGTEDGQLQYKLARMQQLQQKMK